ncbi:MAG TPA: TetR/AcrR family transcriptional regulator [Acidimicrobiales bacterium]|jgi:AcrR family transcriptional regulator|nr:TetR/AcrR family transcriptional regulator [Acidimicrobiales bacterium]
MSRPRDERASQAITEAAQRQLAELGYANLSMESVAAEAGVARATVYRRYRDKADLVTAAIAANGGGDFPGEASQDPRADLVRFLVEFDGRFAEHCLEVLGALLGSREDPGALSLHRERVIDPRMGYARALLVRARELGLTDPTADPDLVLQMLTGAVFARRVSGVPPEDGWIERAVDLVWPAMVPAGS